MSNISFFFFAIFVVSILGCQETIVYVEVPQKPTIVGTWKWVQNSTRANPGVILTPETQGYNRVYVFGIDSFAQRITYYFTGDTLHEMQKYWFEKSVLNDSMGVLEIIIDDVRVQTRFLVYFPCTNIMRWESIGPESVTVIWRRQKV